MKWFTKLKKLEELKKAYHKLIFKYHPDRGGDTATMQEINREYESLFARLNISNVSQSTDSTLSACS